MIRKLTPKQSRFARLYVQLGNASEAYRRSYDCARMKPTTVNRNAKAMLDNSKIAARIDALQLLAQERHNVTVDSLTGELDGAAELAHEVKNPGAVVSATMGKAKLHGLLTDKVEHGVTEEVKELMKGIDGRTRGLPSD